MYGPCLSAIVAGHALTPATRHRLGRLLPHQQADRSKAPLKAGSYALSSYEIMQDYPVFRRDVLHFQVDSLPLLTRLPLSDALAGSDRSTCMPKARRQRLS